MHRPFCALKIQKKYAAPPKQHARPKEKDDQSLFLDAMRDVTPLRGSGREIPCPPMKVTQNKSWPNTKIPSKHKFIFENAHSNDFLSAWIVGLDIRILRKLKNGKYPIEQHLDLHGYTLDQAKLAVEDFLQNAYATNKRCVLLIPGKGCNSPFGQSVLRQELVDWLTHLPLGNLVLAFTSATPKHGGTGAVYTLLRQGRKNNTGHKMRAPKHP